jgi:hypothetical protein
MELSQIPPRALINLEPFWIISHTSPIGAALIGKSVGDSVSVTLANGEKILIVKSIA